MSSVTAKNGLSVLNGEVKIPQTGAWTAEIEIDSAEALTGTIAFGDGSTQFIGTIQRPGEVYSGRLKLNLQGGSGNLGKDIALKAYKTTSVRLVLADILKETGDTLSTASDRALLDRQLPFWHRPKGSAYTAIKSLIIDESGANFRVLRDGSFWVGTDQYAIQRVDHEIVGRNDAVGVIYIAPQTLELDVGRSFEGLAVTELVYTLSPERLRAEVWHRSKPLSQQLEQWLRQELRSLFFTKFYPSIVANVNTAGLADVLPDNAGVADPAQNTHPMQPSGQTGVMVRAGLPGVRLELGAAERCVVGFDEARPSKPYVAGWQKGSTKARIGTLLVVASPAGTLVAVQFFPAGGPLTDPLSGNAMALLAAAAAATASNVPFLVPIETDVWETR